MTNTSLGFSSLWMRRVAIVVTVVGLLTIITENRLMDRSDSFVAIALVAI